MVKNLLDLESLNPVFRDMVVVSGVNSSRVRFQSTISSHPESRHSLQTLRSDLVEP